VWDGDRARQGEARGELEATLVQWRQCTSLAKLCYSGDGSAPALLASGTRQGEGERMEGVEGSSIILAT
jgi:hypothetical protein